MLDCPEQSQTSPTSTSRTVTVLRPVNVRVRPAADAASGARSTRKRPSLATVSTFCPANSTVTFSPSEAVPHTGSITSRWSTA